MSTRTTAHSTHVEAFRSTGTSPGGNEAAAAILPPVGTVPTVLPLDRSDPARVSIRYETQGPSNAPPVVVLGGISAHRHPAPTALDPRPGWWPGVVGPGAWLDTRRLRVIGIDWLGGPESGWRPSAPPTPADQARAIVAVLDHLGVERAAVAGASYGGMVALALATTHAHRVSRVAIVGATHRPHPHATAVRAVQRRILSLSGGGADAVALARALAMTTYRAPGEFDERFAYGSETPAGPARFAVEAYLEARGDAFARRFDAASFATLSASIDLQDVAPERLATPTLVVSVDTDALAPPWLCAELAARAPAYVRHVVISSPWGHDAFLKEPEAVGTLLASFLEVAR